MPIVKPLKFDAENEQKRGVFPTELSGPRFPWLFDDKNERLRAASQLKPPQTGELEDGSACPVGIGASFRYKVAMLIPKRSAALSLSPPEI